MTEATLCWRNLKMQQLTFILELWLTNTLAGKSHYCDVNIFKNLCFTKMQSWHFHIPLV